MQMSLGPLWRTSLSFVTAFAKYKKEKDIHFEANNKKQESILRKTLKVLQLLFFS
jgi:hypothetical protein